MISSYMMPTGRKRKRVVNRLAKKGLQFEAFVQNDIGLITVRAIVTERISGDRVMGRAFVYPRCWVNRVSPRVIADAILSDYQRGYGHTPRGALQ